MSSRGFSLVEVLVAIAILTLAAGSLVRLFTLAQASDAAARHVMYATVLAARKLEELRALAVTAGGEHVEYLDSLGGPVPRDSAVYVRRCSFAAVAGDVTGTLVLIEVSVTPRAGQGSARLYTVRTAGGPW